jgi:membrane protein DedA with SNARE-associated domain
VKKGQTATGRGDDPKLNSRQPIRLIAGVAIWTVLLTLVLYLLAFYLLPSPPPSSAVVSLFSFIAVILIYVISGWAKKRKSDSR